MTSGARAARALAAVALLLDLAAIVLGAGLLRGAVSIDPAITVRDEGLAWRTKEPLLRGGFASVVAEGDRSIFPCEATLHEDEAPLGPARTPHASIRAQGGGRWSLWKGQLYFSTPDGSDPTANGRAYRLEGPWRPTTLLLLLAGAATVAAVVLLRRADPRFRAGSDRLVDLLATRFDGAGPPPLERLAPWLLAAAVAIAWSTDRVGDWFAWDFNDPRGAFLPPYAGWNDLWISGALLLAVVASRRAPSTGVIAALALVTACLAAGGLPQAPDAEWRPQVIGLIQGARFALAFMASWCVVRAGGARAALPAISLLGALVLVGTARAAWTAKGQFIQVGGQFPSFAGMVLGLVAVAALARGAFAWLAACAVGIVATGSRSAAAALVIASAVMLLLRRRDARRTAPARRGRRGGWIAAAVILGAGAVAIASSSQLRDYLAFKATGGSWLSFGRRTEMTRWTLDTLDATGWRPLGWGCGGGAGFIDEGRRLGTMPEDWGNLHVVWLEWTVELGLLAVPLVALVAWRTVAAWRRSALAASIWIFFLLSQSIDYWLWTRDGLLVWGLFLGLAEAIARRPSTGSPDAARLS